MSVTMSKHFDILDNHAPVLEGALRVYVNSGQSFVEPYIAYDLDGDNISVFELKVTYTVPVLVIFM